MSNLLTLSREAQATRVILILDNENPAVEGFLSLFIQIAVHRKGCDECIERGYEHGHGRLDFLKLKLNKFTLLKACVSFHTSTFYYITKTASKL